MSTISTESSSHVHKSDLLRRFYHEIDYIHFTPDINYDLKKQIKNVMCTKGFEVVDSAMNSNTYEQIYALKAKIHITFWESTYKIHLEIVFGSESYPVKCPSFKVLCPRIQSDALTMALVNYKPNPTSKVIDAQGHVITPLMKQWDQDHHFPLLDILRDIKYQFECCFPYVYLDCSRRSSTRSKEHIIDPFIRALYIQGEKSENLFSPQTLLQVSVVEREVKRDPYNSRNIYSIRDGIYNGNPVTIYLYNSTSLETKIYIDRAICTYINLRHPHLISTYGKCMYNSLYPCIVLESHHISLFQYIKSLKTPLSPEDKKEMILQIADGLMYIHDHHFIHRNLNPHCIFLCKGMLKIGGYEYIRNIQEQGDLSNTGESIYKAPEQVLYHNIYYNDLSGSLGNSYDNLVMNSNSGFFTTNTTTVSVDSAGDVSMDSQRGPVNNGSDNLSVNSSYSNASTNTKLKRILEYNQSVDIHAFSLIVYFIYTSEEPFDGEWNDRVFNAFFRQNCRPSIPSYVPHAIANLITHCWNPKPEKRPNIKAVYNYIYNFDPSSN